MKGSRAEERCGDHRCHQTKKRGREKKMHRGEKKTLVARGLRSLDG